MKFFFEEQTMIPSYKATVEKAKTALRAWQASPAWADPSQDHVKANELIQSLGDLRLPGVVLLGAAKELDAVLYERLKAVLSSKNTQLAVIQSSVQGECHASTKIS